MSDNADFALRGEHITLDALLKATGLAPSGGGAKQMIANGQVQVDGQVELRRGAKLRAGQQVQVGAASFRIVGAPAGTPEDAPRPDHGREPDQQP